MSEAINLHSFEEEDKVEAFSLRRAEARSLREIFESSSISGLPKIVGADNPYSRFFWTILLIGGIIGFAINMYYLTQRFVSEPVLNIQVAEYEKFVWPEIVLCNPMNPLPFWRLNYSTKWNDLQKKTKRFLNLTYNYVKLVNYEHALLMSSINPHEFGVHQASNMFPFWRIKFESSGISAFTNSYYDQAYMTVPQTSHFQSRQHVILFPTPCYSFSTTTQPVLMAKDRLDVLGEILFPISTIAKDYERFNCHVDDRGVHLYIIPVNATIPDRRTARLTPGRKVKASLRMHRNERLKSKTNCTDARFEIELYDALFQTSRVFHGTFSDCKSFVTQRLFLETCKCYNPFFPIHRSSQHPPKLCLNTTLFSDSVIRSNLKCMNKVLAQTLYSKKNNDDFVASVDRQCGEFKRLPCNEVSYSVDTEVSEISENVHEKRKVFASQVAEYLPGLKKGDSLKKIKNNVILLNVAKLSNFGSYNAQELEYDVAQFISDIGGIVGLWIGLSVVGVFELLEMLFAAVRYGVIVRTLSREKTEV